MARQQAAVILFTLSAEAESRRKPLLAGDRATAVFAALLEHLHQVCSRLAGVDFVIASPDGTLPIGDLHLPQRGRDFGDSLRLTVEDAFDLGYRRVVVIGNDAPELSSTTIRRAFSGLEDTQRRAVLCPTLDGGYALLGLNRPCGGAFEEMPWGSRAVAGLTRERLIAGGFRLLELSPLEDIDDRGALIRFLSRARNSRLDALAHRVCRALSPRQIAYFVISIRRRSFDPYRSLAARAPPLHG